MHKSIEQLGRDVDMVGCSRRGVGAAEQEPRQVEGKFLFHPPSLHVEDDWRSQGLAIGDTIIILVTGLGYAKDSR